MILEFSPHIRSDIVHVVESYEAIAGPELAEDFCVELWRAFDRALKFPLAYRVRSHGLRRVDLTRFPFHFWFRVIPPDTVRILVIRHHKQRPLGRAEADSLSQGGSKGEVMKFMPVNSRMILGVRYNAKSREMDIVFRTGEKYRYKRVPRSVYDELLNADSHGQYMHKRVLGHYDYERLD
jgi:plasmid stabilization system protein ParE